MRLPCLPLVILAPAMLLGVPQEKIALASAAAAHPWTITGRVLTHEHGFSSGRSTVLVALFDRTKTIAQPKRVATLVINNVKALAVEFSLAVDPGKFIAHNRYDVRVALFRNQEFVLISRQAVSFLPAPHVDVGNIVLVKIEEWAKHER